MIRTVLVYAPSALLWAAVAYRLPALRRSPRDRRLRAYWSATLSFALAATVLLPPVYLAIDGLVGRPNVARLLGNALVLVSAWFNQAFLHYLNYPEIQAQQRIRRAGWVLLGALALLATFFALAGIEEEAWDFTGHHAAAPFVLEFRLVYLGYLAFALVQVVRLAWRYAGLVDRPALRLGLRVVAAGGMVGLAYVAHEALYAATRRLGLTYPLPEPARTTELLIAVAVALLVTGSTMPAWGPRIGVPTLYRWMQRYRAYRRLHALWVTLCEANPEIAFLPRRSALADALRVRNLGFHLYRRVVEIWDGRLALQPYVDPTITLQAEAFCRNNGIEGEEMRAVIEAASLAAALQAKARAHTVQDAASLSPAAGRADVTAEAAFLGKVAHYFMRSPLVPAILARLGDGPACRGPAGAAGRPRG